MSSRLDTQCLEEASRTGLVPAERFSAGWASPTTCTLSLLKLMHRRRLVERLHTKDGDSPEAFRVPKPLEYHGLPSFMEMHFSPK